MWRDNLNVMVRVLRYWYNLTCPWDFIVFSFHILRLSQYNFRAVYCRTLKLLCMTCRGFYWTLCLSLYIPWSLLARACPDRSDSYPLCLYLTLGSWLLEVFRLPCHIILDTLMEFPRNNHMFLHSLKNYVLNYRVGVDLFSRYCYKLDLLLVLTWRWDHFEISYTSTLASSSRHYSDSEPSQFTFSDHFSLPYTS